MRENYEALKVKLSRMEKKQAKLTLLKQYRAE